MVTLWNTQGIPVKCHESWVTAASRDGTRSKLLSWEQSPLSCLFGGLVSLCLQWSLFPSSATQKTRHVHIFCKNIGRAQWPTSWEHLLSKLDLCFSNNTGLYRCNGLWQVFLTCWGHFLRVGDGSKDNQSLGCSGRLFIYLCSCSEWATFWACLSFGVIQCQSSTMP